MQSYTNNIQDARGNAYTSGVTVLVKTAAGVTATIYSDNILTALANPITPSATTGSFTFYAANGDYTLTVSGAGTVPIIPLTLFDDDALSASTGSALVGHTSGGTVAANLDAKATTANLSATTGAGLVGLDTALVYGAGTVGADLVAARPIARGGTGGISVAAALTNLGVLNVGSETTINATLTIANSFPASYLITDSAVPADYNIFLPAAASVGSLVYFRVLPTATKLFTLYDSGVTMDGVDRRILWAGESCMLKKTATGWTKIGGQSIPLRGALIRTANQVLTAATWVQVLFTAGSQDSKGLNFCFDSVNSCFKAPRDGTWRFSASFSVSGMAAGNESFGSFSRGNTGTALGTANAIDIRLSATGLSRLTHNMTIIAAVARTDQYAACVRPAGASASIEYLANTLEITMSYEEIVTW